MKQSKSDSLAIKKMQLLDDEVNKGRIRLVPLEKIFLKFGLTKKGLKKEKEIAHWAVKLQHASREGRFKELKKKGFV